MANFCVAALYKFAPFPDFADHRAPLLALCTSSRVKGILLLAQEGINGTIAGPEPGIMAVLDYIKALPGFGELELKFSTAEEDPFYRMKVRLKREIVTMGVDGVDAVNDAGTYVDPADWNDLIKQPDIVVIDSRNDYEVRIGTFDGAINPHTKSFRDFPDWFNKFREENPAKKVAMFCTGGIRCEKSTAFLRSQGVEEVYHLKGGILKYLETQPETESLWQGECFVFDQRVALKHRLEEGSYDLCYACREPIDDADKRSPLFEPGISCPHCYGQFSDEQRRKFAERQKQVKLAKSRGQVHLGAVQKRNG